MWRTKNVEDNSLSVFCSGAMSANLGWRRTNEGNQGLSVEDSTGAVVFLLREHALSRSRLIGLHEKRARAKSEEKKSRETTAAITSASSKYQTRCTTTSAPRAAAQARSPPPPPRWRLLLAVTASSPSGGGQWSLPRLLRAPATTMVSFRRFSRRQSPSLSLCSISLPSFCTHERPRR